MAQIKTHMIAERDRRNIRTFCGKEGYEANGYEPRPGQPGEYDTPICDRFHATDHEPDVDCQSCIRFCRKEKRRQ